MKIMVFNVAADGGGALTILNQYYKEAIREKKKTWFFIISTPKLVDADNVKVLRYPWVKKSWFHRLYFDYFVAHRIIKKYEVDEILSLQNIILPNISIKQTLYLHQSLPFAEKRYSITESYKLWIYQNVISQMIFKSIRNADQVIVQTYWMKEACIRKTNVSADKIVVVPPKFNIKIKESYMPNDRNFQLFFYPANAYLYKNHKIIVEAVELLKKHGYENYRVILTIHGNENKNIKQIFETVKNKALPIDFIGKIPIEDVYDYYSKSILIFPSYIESFPLPLLEAKAHRSPIIVSNCAFSHEVLDDYENVQFFDPFNSVSLYKIMKDVL